MASRKSRESNICKEWYLGSLDDGYFAFYWKTKFGKLRLRIYKMFCINKVFIVLKVSKKNAEFNERESTSELFEFISSFYYEIHANEPNLNMRQTKFRIVLVSIY